MHFHKAPENMPGPTRKGCRKLSLPNLSQAGMFFLPYGVLRRYSAQVLLTVQQRLHRLEHILTEALEIKDSLNLLNSKTRKQTLEIVYWPL